MQCVCENNTRRKMILEKQIRPCSRVVLPASIRIQPKITLTSKSKISVDSAMINKDPSPSQSKD